MNTMLERAVKRWKRYLDKGLITQEDYDNAINCIDIHGEDLNINSEGDMIDEVMYKVNEMKQDEYYDDGADF